MKNNFFNDFMDALGKGGAPYGDIFDNAYKDTKSKYDKDDGIDEYVPTNVNDTIDKLFTLAKSMNDIKICKMASGNFEIRCSKNKCYGVYSDVISAKLKVINLVISN